MNYESYENAIEVRGLSKSFDDFRLNNISFTLPRGTIMGLIGENGAGKSTTIKLLLSLLRKDSGTIRLFDQPLEGDNVQLRSHIGSLLDDGFFYEERTPAQMAKVLSRCHPRWDNDHFLALLNRFQLDSSKQFKELSRGMKVKTKLATALATHPQLLLLDEPTSGLDPVARSQFLDLLQEYIQDENCSVLLSSHITSDLERVADYITYIHQGKILLSEETADLLDRYAIYRCSLAEVNDLSSREYISYRRNSYSCDVLIGDRRAFMAAHPDAILDSATLEDIMTLYAYKAQ